MSQQIFLSYARRDNRPPPSEPNAKGFVTALTDELDYAFNNKDDPSPGIWRDVANIRGAEQFDPKIRAAINASSYLVVVLSTNWMRSEYCRKELELFRDRWRSEDDDTFRRRVVVVHRNFVERSKHPDHLRGQEGYRFFAFPSTEEESGTEFLYYRGKKVHPAYDDTLEELAYHLWKETRPTGGPELNPPPPPPPPPRGGRKIYLARPSLDLELAYQQIAERLEQEGFDIRPPRGADIPCDETATDVIDEALAACEVSVHILGIDAGFPIAGGRCSVGLQLARAALRVESTDGGRDGFRRVVWAPKLPPSGSNGARKERDPHTHLRTIDRFIEGDKVDGGGVNDFATFLLQNLGPARMPIEPIVDPESVAANNRPTYYVHHNEVDYDFALEVAIALESHGAEIRLPGMDGDDSAREALHRLYMRDCDGIVLCWGGASDTWAKSYSAELRDWRTLGRSRQFKVRGLAVGPPDHRLKSHVNVLWPKSEIDVFIPMASPGGLPSDVFPRLGLE